MDLPCSSTSVELDLGSVSVSNVLMYRPVASPPGSRVNRMRPPHAFSALMDHINVRADESYRTYCCEVTVCDHAC